MIKRHNITFSLFSNYSVRDDREHSICCLLLKPIKPINVLMDLYYHYFI